MADGPNPSILVGGTAAINGAHLDVTTTDIGNQRSAAFPTLTAQKALNVSNTDVTTGLPTLVPVLKQDANSLFVVLLNAGLDRTSRDRTIPAAAGAAIDRVKGTATGDLGVVVRELTALDDHALNGTLEMVAGDPRVQVAARRDRRRIVHRSRAHRIDGPRARAHRCGMGRAARPVVGQLSGQHARFDRTDISRGGFADLGGGAGGLDWRASDRWLFGGGGGFGAGHMSLGGVSGSTDYQAPRARVRGLQAARLRPCWRCQCRTWFIEHEEADRLCGGAPARARRDAAERRASIARPRATRPRSSAMNGASTATACTCGKMPALPPYVEALVRREMTNGRIAEVLELADTPNSTFLVQGLPAEGNAFAGHVGSTLFANFGAFTLEYRFRKSPGQTRQSVDSRVRFK